MKSVRCAFAGPLPKIPDGGRADSPLTTAPNNSSISLRYDANNVYLDIAVANPNQSFSFSSRESRVFNPVTVVTDRTTVYSTRIIGRLLGGTPLYDQTSPLPLPIRRSRAP